MCTADVHNSVSDLKDLSKKDDMLTSGLDGKASESHVMGLSASVDIKGVTSIGQML